LLLLALLRASLSIPAALLYDHMVLEFAWALLLTFDRNKHIIAFV
jgi:hypothetical protein